jgi:hypothetical protein
MQMEFVRAKEQLRAIASLRDNRSSLAVALPGSESRPLQARASNSKLEHKLLCRVAGLQFDLGWDEPAEPSSSVYQEGLAALRDEHLRKAQKGIERDVAVLGSILQERQQLGAASRLTRNQHNRAARRRKRIRQLVDSMAAWQQLDLPASPASQLLPARWTEQVVLDMFKGSFPWKQGEAGGVSSLLAEQFREACAEVRLHVVIDHTMRSCANCMVATCNMSSSWARARQ